MIWNYSFETGVNEIDRQNFDLINHIEEMMQPLDNRMKLMQLIFFEELVKKYFSREQRLHDKNRYFSSEEHKFYHKAYLKVLQEKRRNFAKMGDTVEDGKILVRDLFEFLKNHIMCHDKLFAYSYNYDKWYENVGIGYEKTRATVAV